ncbi:alpha/beta fold hydrolase [Novosphingobium sp. KACC 22771]|uniref:alpha/beta fold hydrolase n=1 Tax=Novosphingobium sp. KACC 22771 TaxID=3025670 RepID=UPI002365320A|nr:alpha/beta hydrolase [Novosphingobium sp. KACC 22771]WDF74851.1 alpha/beta hydrolase [Novosphingobium sp. KACC 22771]
MKCLRPVLLVGSLLAAGLVSPLAHAQTAPAGAAAPSAMAHPYLTVAQLRAKYRDPASRFMTIKGVEVHYKDEGPRGAPVLFMVHGSLSTLRTWDVITARLKSRYRIIRYDIPGYGLSGRVSDEAGEHVQPVEIPEGLLDALHVKKISFVGVSSGGTMGMYLAAKRPEMVERLILSNTPSDPVDTSHLVMPKSFVDGIARAKANGGYNDRPYWDDYLGFFAGDAKRISKKTRDEYYDFNRRTPEKYPIALVARIGDGKQATIEMAKVKAPTLLLWGAADPLLPESAANAIARYLSHATISRVLMPDVGHYPPLEVGDRFAQLIAAYVEAGTPKL